MSKLPSPPHRKRPRKRRGSYKINDCDLYLKARIANGELVLEYEDCRVPNNGAIELEHDQEKHRLSQLCIHFDEPGYQLHVMGIEPDGDMVPWYHERRHFRLGHERQEKYFFLLATGDEGKSPRALFLDPILILTPKPPPPEGGNPNLNLNVYDSDDDD